MNKRIGVAGMRKRKGRGGKKDVFLVAGKSEEAADLKKYLKMLLD